MAAALATFCGLVFDLWPSALRNDCCGVIISAFDMFFLVFVTFNALKEFCRPVLELDGVRIGVFFGADGACLGLRYS